MSNIYNKAHELVNAIKDSEDYKRYIALKKEVYANDKNKEMLDDFRNKAIELQLAQMSGEEVDTSKLEELKKLEEVIMLNPSLKDFMEAELKFSQIVQDINKIIADGIDID